MFRNIMLGGLGYGRACPTFDVACYLLPNPPAVDYLPFRASGFSRLGPNPETDPLYTKDLYFAHDENKVLGLSISASVF